MVSYSKCRINLQAGGESRLTLTGKRKEKVMKKRFVVAMLLASALCMGSVAYAAEKGTDNGEAAVYTLGDSADISKDELMDKLNGAIDTVDSVKSSLVMDMDVSINVGGSESETGVQMGMNLDASLTQEEIFEPYTSHTVESMTMSIMGQDMGQTSETYTREENGVKTSYTGTVEEGAVNEWAETTSDSSISFQDVKSVFQGMGEMNLQEQKALDGDGREYYVLEGTIDLTGESGEEGFTQEIQQMMDGLSSSLGEGSISLPDSVVMNAYISADDFLPAEFVIDMSGIKGEGINSGAEGTNMDMEFSVMVIRFACSDFNAFDEIIFPENLPAGE